MTTNPFVQIRTTSVRRPSNNYGLYNYWLPAAPTSLDFLPGDTLSIQAFDSEAAL